MISLSCLKVVGSYSDVCLSGVIVRCCDFSFINYALCQANLVLLFGIYIYIYTYAYIHIT